MFTVVTDAGAQVVDAERRGSSILVSAEDLLAVTGWELKAEGLCRGDVCVPTRNRPDVAVEGRVDFGVVADVLGRPFVLDDDVDVAVLGESSATRAEQRAAMDVHDLVLRDVDGEPFVWSAIGRKKKVLVAWASW